MILYGASGHGKVIAEILRQKGVNKIVFWDDNVNATLNNEKIVLPAQIIEGEELIISVGLNHVRYDLSQKVKGARFANAIHENAVISKTISIGLGTVVMAMAVINASSEIGNHVIINTGSIVEHDCIINNFVHISPGAVICGGVTIGEGTWIGAGAKVKNGVTIGKWVIIGIGAVVLADIPDYAVFTGVPVKLLKENVNIRK